MLNLIGRSKLLRKIAFTFLTLAISALFMNNALQANSGADRDIVVDAHNGFTLRIPQGWTSHAPSPEATLGVTEILNYVPEDIQNGDGRLPESAIKVQIFIEAMPSGDFDTWVANSIARESLEFVREETEKVPVTSGLESIAIAGYSGVSYVIQAEENSEQPSILIVYLPVREGQVLSVGIMPANSSALTEVIGILYQLEFVELHYRRGSLPV
ncbi:MAG: hypothetical protein KDD73_16065 [Anaerolineales bacterium]|nr:hypothetical protein [Anaerolineales bacterium]